MAPGTPPAKRPVSSLQREMAAAPERPELGEVDREPAKGSGGRPARGMRAELLDRIFESAERDGEGFRHTVLGAPRYGKTYHLKEVVTAALDRDIVDVVFVHDCKRADVQYEGQVRGSVEDLVAIPLDPEGDPVIVFHAQPACSVEAVSAFALARARSAKLRSLVLVDELYQGLKARQVWDVPSGSKSSTAEILREGSSQGVSYAATTQIPQALPTECIDLPDTVAIYHLDGRSLSYACDQLRLPKDAEQVIRGLKRGECVLWTAAEGCDLRVYGPN